MRETKGQRDSETVKGGICDIKSTGLSAPSRMPLSFVLQWAESLFAYSVVFVQDSGSVEPWLRKDHWQPDPG